MVEYDKEEPIAIVGAACRLSGEVSSLGSLWDMISRAKTGRCRVPAERWDADTWYHSDPDRKGGISLKHGYFLKEDVSQFDAPFFSTTAKEAAAMDPMKRLLLEVSYECIENAGTPVEDLMNSYTGCYVGCMTNDYEMLSLHDVYDIGHTAASATSEAMTANRVSWFYGLRGPSLTLDTACSSSLYALHLACQSLKLNETNMALVAGVNLMLSPNTMHQLSAMHMLSPDGISHTFDDRANGYGRGEGIGCLAVKRLADALRDGDTVRAIVRGTGANADGKTPSITQPSMLAQADLINRTYEMAGLAESSTQYFESHGTGTPVGDPIEMEAIATTLGASRWAAGLGPLYVGSIKPNVGHTEGCSGLAGVFKSLACLERGMLVPTHGVESLNPKLRLSEWNLALPPHTMKWPTSGQRRISINSFGFGGANAHVILDDAYHYLTARGLVGNHSTDVHDDDDGSESGISKGPSTPLSENDRAGKRLFVFSTKDQAGMKRMSSLYTQALEGSALDKTDPRYLTNLAYTLSVRRSHFDFRSFCVASTVAELGAQLSLGLPAPKRSLRQQDCNLVFIFTGQGAQWPAMGRELLSNPVFEESVQSSCRHLKNLGCEWDVFEELERTSDSNIDLPQFSQTLCTVIQIALVDLLRSWNVMPRATVGHSSGEIGAAYAASYITRADAVKIAYIRGLSSAAITREGAMLAAGLSQAQALEYLAKVPHESAVVACINSPSSLTLSGDVDAINTLQSLISADGKFARKLKVKTAYHSPHMRAVAQGYLEQMGQITPLTDSTADSDVSNGSFMFSSLTGKLVQPEELNAQYWVSNMCAPVEFSAALSALLTHAPQPINGARGRKSPVRWGGLVELGPHAALQGPVKQIVSASTSQTAKDSSYVSMLSRGMAATETALTAAGQLWASGHNIDLSAVNGFDGGSVAGRKVLTSLPPYPWNHSRRFWHEAYVTRSMRFPSAPRTDLLGMPEELQNSLEPRWKNYLRISENPWIEDHQITGTILYPAAGMLVMAMEGALQTADQSRKLQGFRFQGVAFERGLVVTSGDDAPVETRLSLQPHKTIPGQSQFTIYSTTTGASWTKHCSGTVILEYAPTTTSEVEESATGDVDWARHSRVYEQLTDDGTAEEVDADKFYDQLETIGMEYGPLFRNVVSLSAIPSMHAAHGAILIPDTKSSMPMEFEFPHVMHPATMDSIFHVLLAAFTDGKPADEAAVPYHIEDMFVAREQPQGAGARFQAYGQLVTKGEGGREIVGDLVVSDEKWSGPKLTAKGFALRQVTSGDGSSGANSTSTKADDALRKCARVEWREDVDFIKSGQGVTRLHCSNNEAGTDSATLLSAWLDRLSHKKVIGEVLLVLDGTSYGKTADIVRDVWTFANQQSRVAKVNATATESVGLDILHNVLPSSSGSSFHLWEAGAGEEPPAPGDSYDVVLVVGDHAIGSQIEQLAQLHKMLSPRGHLVVLQTEEEESRADRKTTLQDQGFTDPIAVPCEDSPKLFIAGASSSVVSETVVPSEVYLLVPPTASPQTSDLVSVLTFLLQNISIKALPMTLSTPDMSNQLAGKHVISLLEIESPFVYSWDETNFASVKALVSSVQHMLWLTRGGLLQSSAGGPEFAPAQGLLRVLRNEYTLATLPQLDLSIGFDAMESGSADLILDVWRSSLAEGAEMEYAELDGAIHIPRAVEDTGFDGELQLATGNAKPVLTAIRESSTALKMSSAVDHGYLWVEDEEAALPLAPGEVEIEVEFVGLSDWSSIAQDDGSILDGFGHGAVGVVSRCGESVKSVSAGQRVVVFQTQTCRTHARQDESLVARVPAGVSSQEAAAMPSVFIAAQYSLLEVAGLSRDKTVLLHSAASGLGQAALQVAQFVGARVFALVGSKQEKDVLVERYGVCPSHIFDSSLRTFVTEIMRLTDGRGVDVVLLDDATTPAALPCLTTLGDFGCFLDLSTSHPDRPEFSLPSPKRNASINHIDIARAMETRTDLVKTLFQRTFDFLCRAGIVAPIFPTEVFSVDSIVQAVDAAKAQQHYGKVVLSLGKDSSVLTLPRPAPALELNENATYVLAGGLGALGLQIADMMVERGAGNLVFLSRSGGGQKEKDLERLRGMGVHAEAFRCDVNDATSVAAVFDQLKSDGHVVKGVIQSAMVLEDTIFDNMTYDKWSRSIFPKTHGSHNLLTQLSPTESPFFILLSSITGIIGNTAQANYASGNTFEDALAHYARAHLSINATSIDVGLVSDSSHFTSAGGFGDLENYLHKYQHGWKGLQTSVEELRVVLKAVMRGSTADGQSVPPQLVLGLGNALVREDGFAGFERDRKFELRVVKPSGKQSDKGLNGVVSVGERLSTATSLAEAATAVEDSFKQQIAAAIGVTVDEVDGQKQLPEFGVDSLKAVEIRNRALKEMQSDISVFELLSATPLGELATKIASRSRLVKVEAEEEN